MSQIIVRQATLSDASLLADLEADIVTLGVTAFNERANTILRRFRIFYDVAKNVVET